MASNLSVSQHDQIREMILDKLLTDAQMASVVGCQYALNPDDTSEPSMLWNRQARPRTGLDDLEHHTSHVACTV